MSAPLGIIAGRGDIPRALVATRMARDEPVFVIAFPGETRPATVEGVPHAWVDLAKIGHILETLKQAGCRDLVLIGPIRLPNFAALKPDWRGLRLLPKAAAAARRGDDSLMTLVVGELEAEGFRVIGAETVLADLAVPLGPLGRHRPNAQNQSDIARGLEVVHALGALDVGQAAVVRGGYVLAVEAAEGTDAMLDRVGALDGGAAGGVMVKVPKPQQERRADLPTVGAETVRRAIRAGLAGIALEAGGALFIERDEAIRLADGAGLFLTGLAAETDR